MATVALSPHRTQHRVRPSFYGINGNDIWKSANAGIRSTLLANLASAGIEHIRFPFEWLYLEPTAPTGTGPGTEPGRVHSYRWGPTPPSTINYNQVWETAVYEAAQNGMRILPVVTHAPDWAARYAQHTAIEKIALNGATGGTFALTFPQGGATPQTTSIAWNASAATVDSALRALGNVDDTAGKDLVVTRSGADGSQTYTITFQGGGQYADNTGVKQITGDGANLIGVATITATTPTPGTRYSCPSTANMPDWLFFVESIWRRYGPKIGGDTTTGTFWRANAALPYHPMTAIEIWNEQDAGYGMNWGTALDHAGWLADATVAPAEYADLFARASARLKAIDPGCLVVSGGLAGGPSSPSQDRTLWTSRVFAAAVANGIDYAPDAVAIHPYGGNPVGSGNAHPEGAIKLMRTTLDGIAGAGKDMPIWVTEIGWDASAGDAIQNWDQSSWVAGTASGGSIVNQETTRASWYAEIGTRLPISDCNVQQCSPFGAVTSEVANSYTDGGGDVFTLRDLFLGMWNASDGSPKGSATAWANAIASMTGPTPHREIVTL